MNRYAIFILAVTFGIAAGLCLRHVPTAQVFNAEQMYSVVVDAGHGALGDCFKR